MGRDASVHCRCWVDGRTTEPPVPRELIERVDWADAYRQTPRLREDADYSPATYQAFEAWKEHACEHRWMSVLSERIFKWGGTGAYFQAIDVLGEDRFPVLRSAGWGYGDEEEPLPAEKARLAVAELDRLRTLAAASDLGELTEVIDVESGARWLLNPHLDSFERPPQYNAPPWAVSVDHQGLFVWDLKAEGHPEVFRATRLSVEVAEAAPGGRSGRGREHHIRFQHPAAGPCDCVPVTLTNLDTGAHVTLEWARRGEPFGQGTRFLRVWTRPMLVADFAEVLSALRSIFQAAADTGTPVVWC